LSQLIQYSIRNAIQRWNWKQPCRFPTRGSEVHETQTATEARRFCSDVEGLKVCHMSILELLVVHFISSYRDHLKRMGGFRTHYYRVCNFIQILLRFFMCVCNRCLLTQYYFIRIDLSVKKTLCLLIIRKIIQV